MNTKTWKKIRIVAMLIIASMLFSNCTKTNSEAEILFFSFEEQTDDALINSFYKAITVSVDTVDVANLVPTIVISSGATIDPLSNIKQDFTNSVNYTIISEDRSTTNIWKISVDSPDNLLPEEPNTQSAEDNSKSETAITRIFEYVNHYGISEEGKKSIKGEPDSISWVGNTVTIYFEEGSIISAFNMDPSLQAEGLEATVIVVNFVIHGTRINGTFTLSLIQVIDIIKQEDPIFDLTAINDLVFIEGTLVSTWNGNKQITWIEGYSTINDPEDDIFLIKGSSTGVNIEGNYYTAAISVENPIRLDDCEWFSSGIVNITEGKGEETNEIVINYGDGTCDNIMIVTIDGVEITVEID